ARRSGRRVLAHRQFRGRGHPGAAAKDPPNPTDAQEEAVSTRLLRAPVVAAVVTLAGLLGAFATAPYAVAGPARPAAPARPTATAAPAAPRANAGSYAVINGS